jgi:signal transduction histidine kinase
MNPPMLSPLGGDYPAYDGIIWQEDSLGISVKEILPQSPNEHHLEAGDRLIHIDYHKFSQLKALQTLFTRSTPGTIITYGIERQKDQTRENLLIMLSFDIPGLDLDTRWGIGGFAGYNILACIIIIFLTVLILPFLLTQWRVNGWILVLLLSAFLIHSLNVTRLLNAYLQFQQPEKGIYYDKIYFFLYLLSWLIASIAIWQIRFHSKHWLNLLIVIIVGFIVWRTFEILWKWQQLKILYEYVISALVLFFIGTNLYLPRQWKFTFFSLKSISIGFGLLQMGITASLIWSAINSFQSGLTAGLLFCHFPLMYTVFLNTRAGLKYGKVNTVLIRTLILLTTYGILTLLYYWATGLPFTHALIHIGIVIGVGLIIFRLSERFRYRLEDILATAAQRRRKLFLEFIRTIPRIANSSDLIETTEKQTKAYFDVDVCSVQVVPKGRFPVFGKISETETEQIFELTTTDQRLWARSKELSSLTFPPQIEQKLIQGNIYLVNTFFLASGEKGWLILGKRKNGYFNLEDVETIAQLVQQMRLSLDILFLIERQKVLAEKTMEANLIALRAQINPHFLFNTFNSISDLIHINPAGAEEALEKLAYIFRYTLKSSKDNFAILENELKLIRNYLDIEQIRFGERLKVDINYDPECLDVEIPAFTLQTIVENCIKHGIAKLKDKGLVRITVRESDEFLVIEVYDNGPGIDLTRIYKSTGLSNILQRMETLYQRTDLLLFQNTGNGTLVTLKIPFDND